VHFSLGEPSRGLWYAPPFYDAGMKLIAPVAVVLAGALVTACAADPYGGPRQDAGAVAGAVAGGIIGSSVAGRGVGNRLAGAAIGAVAGGILGGAIGAALDDADRQRAYEAERQALAYGHPGTPVAWRNPDSGRYGNVVPGPVYPSGGRSCREYSHTIYIDGRPRMAQGIACRNPDGSWSPVA
jgi:surface antigen